MNEGSDKEPASNPDVQKWWRHRRWQSYAALSAVVGLGSAGVAGLVPSGAAPIVQTAIWALTTVVVIYHGGASAVDAVRGMKR